MKFTSALAGLAVVVASANADVTVDLGTAADFTVVAVGGIANVGASAPIIGSVATTGHNVTGFAPGAITGAIEEQTPAADQAHADAESAWLQLLQLEGTPVVSTADGSIIVTKGQGDANGMGTTNFTGAVFTPGIYNVLSIITVITNITLSGEGQFIFTSGSHFRLNAGASIILADGAQASDVYFATGDSTTLMPGAHVSGTILSNSAITLDEGASVLGNIFSQSHIAISDAAVTPVH